MVEVLIKKCFPGPFEYQSGGQLISDKDGNIVLDVRGWGRLIGTGEGGMNFDEEKAEIVQDLFGKWVAETLNKEME